MRASEWLGQIRDCALQIRHEEQRLEVMGAKLGPHGHGGSISAGSYLDPMRQVDEYLDAQGDAASTMRECNRVLDQSWPVVAGIARLGTDDAAQLVARRYFWGEDWADIAAWMGCDSGECQYACGIVCAWIDQVGIARLMEEGRADD